MALADYLVGTLKNLQSFPFLNPGMPHQRQRQV